MVVARHLVSNFYIVSAALLFLETAPLFKHSKHFLVIFDDKIYRMKRQLKHLDFRTVFGLFFLVLTFGCAGGSSNKESDLVVVESNQVIPYSESVAIISVIKSKVVESTLEYQVSLSENFTTILSAPPIKIKGDSVLTINATVDGLSNNRNYYCRLKIATSKDVFYTKTFSFTTHEYEFSEQVAPAYMPLNNMLEFGGWWYCQELTTDEMVIPTRGDDWDQAGQWRQLQLHNWTDEHILLNKMWIHFYNGISNCNQLIGPDAIDRKEALTAKEKGDLARHLALRAFYYWQLIDNFGDVPYVRSNAISAITCYKTKRTSIFKHIEGDLIWAIQHLKKENENYIVSKGMAQMALARLYLNAKVYTGNEMSQSAIPILEDLIHSGNYGLAANVREPFLVLNAHCRENIFTAHFTGDETLLIQPQLTFHMNTLGYQSNLTYKMETTPWNGTATLESHFFSYLNGDSRRDAYFIFGPQKSFDGSPLKDLVSESVWDFTPQIPALLLTKSNGFSDRQMRQSGVRVQKYEIEIGAKLSMANDFVFFRLTDAYLMLAECYALLGNSVKVKQYLEPIRARAGLAPLTQYDLAAVMKERKLEMFFEGSRRQDMIRWGIFNKPWNCPWAGQINTSNNNLFPIPKIQISANRRLSDPAVD